MQVLRMKVPEKMNDPHKIHFDNLPTRLEESSGVPIGPRGLITRHVLDSEFNLILREGVANAMQIRHL
jgi:hypothetical protein